MANNPTYFALLEACEQPGCPVCRVIQKSVERYLESLFYEQVNDSAVRRNLRKSLGFCHTHARLALDKRLGDALGVAIIYQDILGYLLKRLPAQDAPELLTNKMIGLVRRTPRQLLERLKLVKSVLTPQERCPACQQHHRTTQRTLETLVKSLSDKNMLTSLENSEGLCISHLRLAFEQINDPKDYTALLSISRKKLESLHTELSEFIRKTDYRFQDEGFGHESDAWRRAMENVAGGIDVSRQAFSSSFKIGFWR